MASMIRRLIQWTKVQAIVNPHKPSQDQGDKYKSALWLQFMKDFKAHVEFHGFKIPRATLAVKMKTAYKMIKEGKPIAPQEVNWIFSWLVTDGRAEEAKSFLKLLRENGQNFPWGSTWELHFWDPNKRMALLEYLFEHEYGLIPSPWFSVVKMHSKFCECANSGELRVATNLFFVRARHTSERMWKDGLLLLESICKFNGSQFLRFVKDIALVMMREVKREPGLFGKICALVMKVHLQFGMGWQGANLVLELVTTYGMPCPVQIIGLHKIASEGKSAEIVGFECFVVKGHGDENDASLVIVEGEKLSGIQDDEDDFDGD